MYLLHAINSDLQTRLMNLFEQMAMFRETFFFKKKLLCFAPLNNESLKNGKRE
jgi:hypothetical protein